MRIKSLQLENWMLIQNCNIQLPENARVLGLIGRYISGEDGRSNRSGKTTIVEAIKYLLYGKGRIRSHDALINRAAAARGESMMVAGVLGLVNGVDVAITRNRPGTGTPIVEVNGEVYGWREANEYIEELIGFTYDEFVSTCYFGQGEIHQFMNSGPKAKRELLLEWLNQTRWESRRSYAVIKASELETTIDAKQQAIAALPKPEKSLDDLEDEYLTLQEKKAKWNGFLGKANDKVEDSEEQLEIARLQDRLGAEKKRIIADTRRLEDQLDEAAGVEEKRLGFKAKKAVQDAVLETITREWKEDTQPSRDGLLSLSADIRAINGDLMEVSKIAANSGVCPVLKEECVRVAGDTDVIDILEKNIRDIKAEKRAIEAVLKLKDGIFEEESDETLERIEDLDELLDSLPSVDIPRLNSEIDRLDDQLEGVTKQIVKQKLSVASIKEQLLAFKNEAKEAQQNLSETKAQMQVVIKETEYVRQREEKVQELQDAVTELTKAQSSWNYVAYMFSDRGIPSEYIKNAFGGLERDVNYILEKLQIGLSVEFKPYKEQKKWEPNCLACGADHVRGREKCVECGEPRQKKRTESLVLQVNDNSEGQVSDFGMDSGGGQVLLSLAVRLALLFLKVREHGKECPPIILDEVVGMLDPVNRAAVINLVMKVLNEEMGIEQVWWISHNEEILEMLNDSIIVTRDGDHSNVEWS